MDENAPDKTSEAVKADILASLDYEEIDMEAFQLYLDDRRLYTHTMWLRYAPEIIGHVWALRNTINRISLTTVVAMMDYVCEQLVNGEMPFPQFDETRQQFLAVNFGERFWLPDITIDDSRAGHEEKSPLRFVERVDKLMAKEKKEVAFKTTSDTKRTNADSDNDVDVVVMQLSKREIDALADDMGARDTKKQKR